MATATKNNPHVRETLSRTPTAPMTIRWTDEERALVVQRGIENRLKGEIFGSLTAEVRTAQEALPYHRRRNLERVSSSTFDWFHDAVDIAMAEMKAVEPEPEPEPEPVKKRKSSGKPRIYWDASERKAIVDEAVRATLENGQRGARSLLAAAIQILPEGRQRDVHAIPSTSLDWFHDGVRVGLADAKSAQEQREALEKENAARELAEQIRRAEEAKAEAIARELEAERVKLAQVQAELESARVQAAERWHETGVTVATAAPPRAPVVFQAVDSAHATESEATWLIDRIASMIGQKDRAMDLLVRIAGAILARLERIEEDARLDRASLLKLASELGVGSTPAVPGTGLATPAATVPTNGVAPAAKEPGRLRVLIIGMQQHLHQKLATPFAKLAYVKVVQEPSVAVLGEMGVFDHIFLTDRVKPDHEEALREIHPISQFHQLRSQSMERVRLDMERVIGKQK